MNSQEKAVTTVDELVAATKDKAAYHIVVRSGLTNAPSIRLAPGQSLRGDGDAAAITFTPGTDGLQLSSDNRLHNIRLNATVNKRAIFNDTSVESRGRIELRSVTTTGCVQILARDKVRGGHVDVNGLDIVAADARGEKERPHGYGVYVINGAFTLWNMQQDTNVAVSADLVGLSAGRAGSRQRHFCQRRRRQGRPAQCAGAGNQCGPQRWRHCARHGGPDHRRRLHGLWCYVDVVRNRGPVVTCGVNDMVLDNWGVVDRWTAEAKITSHGPERHRLRQFRHRP